MSFGNSFVKGLGEGESAFYKAQEFARQKVLDDRATRDDEQKQTAYKRTLGIQSKLDDAYKYSTSLDGGVVDGRTADFSGVNPMADQGPVPQDQMAPVVGMRPQGAGLDSPAPPLVSTPATQRDRLNIARTIATLKQDDAGIARLNEQGLVLDRKDNQRATMTRLQALSKDPGKSAEYATAIAPALKAFSEFDGLPANYHFDPKTKGIVETPYGTKDPKTGQTTYGAPRELPFETVAPYMLAYNNLVSEYGDPETAAAQLKTMKDGERTKRFEEAKQSLEAASKLSTADSSQTTAKAHMITAEAARQRANADKSGRGKEADPALVKRNNDLYDTYLNEPDPVKRAGIERQMQMVQNQIATSLGKPQMLPNSRGERLPVTNADLMTFSEKMGASPTRVPDPGKPGKFLTVSQLPLAQQALMAEEFFARQRGGSGGSGMPDVAPPPRGSADTRLPPVEQPRQYDSDGNPMPMASSPINNGYGTGPDVRGAVRGLLRTPSYSAGGTQFNPN